MRSQRTRRQAASAGWARPDAASSAVATRSPFASSTRRTAVAHDRLVVDHQHVALASCRALASAPPSSSGRRTVKRLPAPFSLSTSIVPPWLSTMPQVIASPSPVPRTPLVVKNGSKSFGEVLARDAAPVVLDAQLDHRRRAAPLARLPAREVTARARAPADRLVVGAAHRERRRAAALARAVRLDERRPAARARGGRHHALLARLGRDVVEAAVDRIEAERPLAAPVLAQHADRRQAADARAGSSRSQPFGQAARRMGSWPRGCELRPGGWRAGSCRRARRSRRRRSAAGSPAPAASGSGRRRPAAGRRPGRGRAPRGRAGAGSSRPPRPAAPRRSGRSAAGAAASGARSRAGRGRSRGSAWSRAR